MVVASIRTVTVPAIPPKVILPLAVLATTVVASTANGRMVLGGALGTVTVTLDATTTGAIGAGRYAYDLVLDSGATVTRYLEGKFIVTGAVTQ